MFGLVLSSKKFDPMRNYLPIVWFFSIVISSPILAKSFGDWDGDRCQNALAALVERGEVSNVNSADFVTQPQRDRLVKAFPFEPDYQSPQVLSALNTDSRWGVNFLWWMGGKLTEGLNDGLWSEGQRVKLSDVQVYHTNGIPIIAEGHRHGNESMQFAGTMGIGRDGTVYRQDGRVHRAAEADTVIMPEYGRTGELGPKHWTSKNGIHGLSIQWWWTLDNPFDRAPASIELIGSIRSFDRDKNNTRYDFWLDDKSRWK